MNRKIVIAAIAFTKIEEGIRLLSAAGISGCRLNMLVFALEGIRREIRS